MPVILASIFSAIIIVITVSSILKVLTVAYKRGEISNQKRLTFATTTIIIGALIASILPLGYQVIFNMIL
ncbi:hypothetical protein [Neobacillus sp. LXY-4]|uniref:hypothetical protein n=1 Tax=Neobacillus sp. LXY-4 TaxID=3379826 RepID=UPI003EE39A82